MPSVPEPKYYSAAWTAPTQSASGSFDLTFTVNTDKYQLNTLEKVDGAVITVTPTRTGGSVDGGSWQMTPAAAQTITTSGHTQDDSFHLNGGDGSATWTVHYEVSKTSTSTLSGQEGPFTSFVSELCDLDRDLMLSIDILPVPTDEAARQLQSTLLA